MALSAKRVVVKDTATLIQQSNADGVTVDPGSSRALRANSVFVTVKNPAGGNTVDLGGSGVVTGGGLTLAAGEDRVIDLAPGESLYGVCAALAEQAVQVLANRVD